MTSIICDRLTEGASCSTSSTSPMSPTCGCTVGCSAMSAVRFVDDRVVYIMPLPTTVLRMLVCLPSGGFDHCNKLCIVVRATTDDETATAVTNTFYYNITTNQLLLKHTTTYLTGATPRPSSASRTHTRTRPAGVTLHCPSAFPHSLRHSTHANHES